jgi:phage tail sheath protein FI
MTPEDILAGRMIVEVSIARQQPAELIVLSRAFEVLAPE